VKIPKKVTERLIKEIPKFKKVLKKAKDRDVNESDTVTIVTDMLANVFGFDKYAEITSEQAIRGTYCDLAIKLDGKIKYLIEVKAIGLKLRENHLRQIIGYGSNQGIPWVVLTNGIMWKIYKIKFERPVSYELVCTIDFMLLNPRNQDDQEIVFLLCKKGITTEAIEEFHDYIRVVNRFTIGAVVLTEPVINVIRKELRQITPGLKVTNEEIESIIATQLLKRDVVEGESFENARKRVKKAAKKAKPKSTQSA
jgi:hypothetical protein